MLQSMGSKRVRHKLVTEQQHRQTKESRNLGTDGTPNILGVTGSSSRPRKVGKVGLSSPASQCNLLLIAL